MKILSNKQYELFLAQQGRIEQLQKENEQLDKENGILRAAISDQDIDFPNSCEESLEFFEEWS